MATILIIEDETNIREEVAEWLEFEGHEVHTAINGEEGIEQAAKYHPDLIICDIRMPKMNGHQVLATIRAKPETVDTAFIFATASDERESIRYGMQLGADDYITKPFTYEELMAAISARLKRHDDMLGIYQQRMDALESALDNAHKQTLLKSRVMAMFSHDFRNPLALIQSSASLMISYYDRISKEEQIQKLKQINSSVQLLLQMLDEMLLIAEMESEQFHIHLECIDIKEFIHGIVNDFAEIHRNHHFNFVSETNASIDVDKQLLRQIMYNLLSNAAKYSPEQTEIYIHLAYIDSKLTLQVSDQGMGIPEEQLVRIFDPYIRATNTKHIKGTGLGLAIVKRAVELCDGEIDVTSQEDVGTTFRASIPG